MPTAPGSSLGDRLLHPESVWDRIVRWGIFSAALAAIVGVVGSAWYFLVWPLRVIFPPVALALVVVYLLNPLVNRLQRRGIRRGLAVALIYVAFVAVVTTALSFIIPAIAHQISGFIDKLPQYVQDVTDWVNKFAAKRGWDFKIDLTTEKIQQYVTDNREAIVGVLGGVRSFAFSVIHILITLIIGIILSIYILLDLPKIQRSVRAMLPENRRDEIVGLTEKIGGALGGFFRGQLLVAMFVGIASAALLTWPARIPFAIVVGLIAGVFNLVPLIGPFIGAIPAVILGLLSGDPKRAWIGALMLLIVQQIDNHIISPNVMGRTVKLHPITVMLALLAAGSLFGIFGMLLIIPTIAAVKAVGQHLWSKRTVRDALAEAYPGNEPPAVFAESVVVESVEENGDEVVVAESTTVVKTGDGKGERRPPAKRRPSRGSQASSSRKRSR